MPADFFHILRHKISLARSAIKLTGKVRPGAKSVNWFHFETAQWHR